MWDSLLENYVISILLLLWRLLLRFPVRHLQILYAKSIVRGESAQEPEADLENINEGELKVIIL